MFLLLLSFPLPVSYVVLGLVTYDPAVPTLRLLILFYVYGLEKRSGLSLWFRAKLILVSLDSLDFDCSLCSLSNLSFFIGSLEMYL